MIEIEYKENLEEKYYEMLDTEFNKYATKNGVVCNFERLKPLDIKKKLEETYIWEIDDKKMEENALEGYVAGLGDEYTEYLTKDEVTSLMQEVNGSYVMQVEGTSAEVVKIQ